MKHDFLEIDGLKIGYGKIGNGPHNVLCVPGALGSYSTDFYRLMSGDDSSGGLDQSEFTMVGWDPPGYGRSRPPDRDTQMGFYQKDAALAHKLMEKLGLIPYSLVGLSAGGVVSMMIAGSQSDSRAIRGLVIISSCSYVDDQDMEIYKEMKNIEGLPTKLTKAMYAHYGKEYFSRIWIGLTNTYMAFRDQPRSSVCLEYLPKIKCPTLILHGKKDETVPVHHAQFIHENISRSRLHIHPFGDHTLHLEYADWFKQHVESFLLDDA